MCNQKTKTLPELFWADENLHFVERSQCSFCSLCRWRKSKKKKTKNKNKILQFNSKHDIDFSSRRIRKLFASNTKQIEFILSNIICKIRQKEANYCGTLEFFFRFPFRHILKRWNRDCEALRNTEGILTKSLEVGNCIHENWKKKKSFLTTGKKSNFTKEMRFMVFIQTLTQHTGKQNPNPNIWLGWYGCARLCNVKYRTSQRISRPHMAVN